MIVLFNCYILFIVTRFVTIGEQSVVRLPEQVPVKLDCWPPAFAAYSQDVNLSSIQWFRKDSLIVDNSTVRNVAISPTNLCLFIDELTIASGAEDGTEAEYTCRVCRNEPPSPRECQEFRIEIIADSKYMPCLNVSWHCLIVYG